MAVLTPIELAEVRRGSATGAINSALVVNWTKPQINAALQAVEDYFETTFRLGVAAAIEAAAPGVFNAAKKKILVGYFLLQKFRREGV